MHSVCCSISDSAVATHTPLATTLHSPASSAPSFGAALVVPEGRPEEVVAFERQVVDFFVGAADILGLVPEYQPHLESV
jgi:hypothetical protein